ncbi:MAG: hypothetical protein J5659_04650 [Clostridia bacterium]|nr:hypothetical protein [Clostridia bacterium]
METIKLKNYGNTKMIAHRGLSGLRLENTISAFNAAGRAGYYGIESDVHVTRDGKFVIFHDDTTRRLCKINLEIEKTEYARLRLLPIKFHRMPNLAEYINCCKRYNKVAVLEIKNKMSCDNIKSIIDIITELDYINETIFISFCGENLVNIRKIIPKQPVQFLADNFNSDIFDMLTSNSFDLDIRFTILNQDIVELCHDNGIKVNCFTVNEPADAERLIDYGVDYITSNIIE